MRPRQPPTYKIGTITYLIIGIFLGSMIVYFLHDPIDPMALTQEPNHKTLSFRPEYAPFLFADGQSIPWEPTSHGSDTNEAGQLLVAKKVLQAKGTSPSIFQVAEAVIQPGATVAHHSHMEAVELFYGLKGRCEFELIPSPKYYPTVLNELEEEGREGEDPYPSLQTLLAGQLVSVNPMTSHAISNPSKYEECKMMVVSVNKFE